MIQTVALHLGRRLSRDDVLKISIAQRSTYLWQNPITGVCMFQHRLQSFFSQYLLNDAHPLGHITDYVIKIEFQMGGSPHAHCLLWVKDAPKINQDSDDNVCRFIDKYITAMMPKGVFERENDVNIMKSLQKHTHSDSQYLLNDAHPLGHITDYMIKIEFQMGGSPHAHCLLWVKDAPKINQHSDDNVCRFIDKYITAMMPKGVFERENDVNIMKSLQKHTHSDYCHRNKSCCFGFPKPPVS